MKSLFYSLTKYILDKITDCYRLLKIKNEYKIVPLGTYCLPRSITTFAKLKPAKSEGELSLPFDLAFFTDIDDIIELIDTNFDGFFDDLQYDDNKQFINISKHAIFNHDSQLSKEDFILRYKNRIKNLYHYLKNIDNHIYILIATFDVISEKQLKNLKSVLTKFRPQDSFDIIVINQSSDVIINNLNNIHIINQCHNVKAFNIINAHGDWIDNIRFRKTFYAQKIYYEIVWNLIKIIN